MVELVVVVPPLLKYPQAKIETMQSGLSLFLRNVAFDQLIKDPFFRLNGFNLGTFRRGLSDAKDSGKESWA